MDSIIIVHECIYLDVAAKKNRLTRDIYNVMERIFSLINDDYDI